MQVLIQIEGLYLALLNLESDQLKLHALPTGAPLREQVIYQMLSLKMLYCALFSGGCGRKPAPGPASGWFGKNSLAS